MKKKIIKGVAFVAILFVINSILSFALIPANGASEVMWNDYYEMEDLDTIYIGSSVCLRSFNPYILDEMLGTNSFNMGTPSQPIDLTYLALQTALNEHDIERVYFGFGYFNLTMPNSQQSEAAFLQARNQHVGVLERVKENLSYMLKKENIGESVSVNFMFPWVYNHVQLQVGSIMQNVQAKLAGSSSENLAMVNDEMRNYVGRGFGYYKGVLDYNNIGNDNSRTHYYGEFRPDLLEKLDAICALCEEKGVELVVINTPRPTFDVISYGEEYYDTYLWLEEYLTERGAVYYDFNFAKPEVFADKPEYYFNFEHLNQEGADAFSKAFAGFEKLRREQKAGKELFYDWTEYVEAVEL
ncbi:MAG: SGNH/GDSL hydrolase family protein [Roseburia sp.]|nr:SGNH/GDSL hydrolase family protein [Roseburia sp.]